MSFTSKELKAVELWEVKKYSNNTILFNQIESPYEHESIAEIGKTRDIKSVTKEIITYSEDLHLQKCDEGTRVLYNELKERILSISPTISIKAKKMYIAFANSRNFVYLKPKRTELELHLSLRKGELNDPKKIAEDIPDKWHGYYAVIVNDKSDLGYILSLIVQAYDKTNPK